LRGISVNKTSMVDHIATTIKSNLLISPLRTLNAYVTRACIDSGYTNVADECVTNGLDQESELADLLYFLGELLLQHTLNLI
jgi:hypothetical protein